MTVPTMDGAFELICEFVHCRGRHTVVLGKAASEDEARRWVEARRADVEALQRLDPNGDCPVACCALRGQPPRCGYRPAATEESAG